MRAISIIIPTLNEEASIKALIEFIWDNSEGLVEEVIVVDARSDDRTAEFARSAGAVVMVVPVRSRAYQMNAGAAVARCEILYFVHADVRIVSSFVRDINHAVASGYPAGCYRFVFDLNKGMLRINSFCTRFNGIMCRGGDQTLFITRELFHRMKGYNEDYTIMEDFELIRRIRKSSKFTIIPKNIVVSARKYQTNSWLRVQMANFTAFMMFFMKRRPEAIRITYKKLLNYR